MSNRARAIYFVRPGAVEVREEAIEPRADSLHVVSHLIGISAGTELLFFRGHQPFELSSDESLSALQAGAGFPVKYGYINVGTVVGDRRRVFAFYPHQDRFWVDRHDCVELPEDLRSEDAVFIAGVETAVSIVHDAVPRIGEVLLVLGLGVIGLLTAELLSIAGGVRVVGVDPIRSRRERMSEIGFPAFDPHDPRLSSKLMELSDG